VAANGEIARIVATHQWDADFTRLYTASRDYLFSLRNGLTAYAVLSPEPNSSGLRRCRLDGACDPVGSNAPPAVWPSHGCQDHTVLPYASCAVRFARRESLMGSTHPATTSARQRSRVHRIPSRVRDDARSAPLAGSGRRESATDLGV